MEALITIIIIGFGILQIVLLFKIWGMTNDIREIKNKYMSETQIRHSIPSINTDPSNNPSPDEKRLFKEDDLVILISSGKQMRIKEITDSGKYSCYTNSGTVHEGDFGENEIKLF